MMKTYWEYDYEYDGLRVPCRGDNVSYCGTKEELFAPGSWDKLRKEGERGRGPGDRLTVVGVDNQHKFKGEWHCWKMIKTRKTVEEQK